MSSKPKPKSHHSNGAKKKGEEVLVVPSSSDEEPMEEEDPEEQQEVPDSEEDPEEEPEEQKQEVPDSESEEKEDPEEEEEEEEEVKSSNNSNQEEEAEEPMEEEQVQEDTKKKVKNSSNATGCYFPFNRIKRLIRSEGDFRITQEAVFVINKATEHFLQLFCEDVHASVKKDRKKSMMYKHLSSTVGNAKRYDFLSDFVPEKIKAEDALLQKTLAET